MLTKMRPRYYCEHCGKGGGSAGAMRRHESACTANPKRICRMCEGTAPPRDELIRILDEHGFQAMCEAAGQCPACILSVIRTKNRINDETGPYVEGPDDGRGEWRYEQAKREWWAQVNAAQFERDGCGY